jgi:hypothetical protein
MKLKAEIRIKIFFIYKTSNTDREKLSIRLFTASYEFHEQLEKISLLPQRKKIK